MKDKRIYLRISDEDLEVLEKKSSDLGLDKSAFIRLLIHKVDTTVMFSKVDKLTNDCNEMEIIKTKKTKS